MSAARPFDDDFAAALPGCVLSHVLTFVSDDALSVVARALDVARKAGAELEALKFSRRADLVTHELTLVGAPPEAARRICGAVAGMPGVRSAAVEHVLARAR